jgi:hypothetical protein
MLYISQCITWPWNFIDNIINMLFPWKGIVNVPCVEGKSDSLHQQSLFLCTYHTLNFNFQYKSNTQLLYYVVSKWYWNVRSGFMETAPLSPKYFTYMVTLVGLSVEIWENTQTVCAEQLLTKYKGIKTICKPHGFNSFMLSVHWHTIRNLTV